ncbi:MFS transporter [Streptomyces sp. NPDC056361]|uniref:MFS transporter n=1 Tax=Streptomyces sp. NPDC056361 TaxID=3345795 RepID=UPI0035DB4FC6
MRRLWRQTRSFPPAVRLLMLNQFAGNIGFSMLMPYLATHLADGLGLAAWAVGLVLGVRHFSQQGMFLVGGTIADRLGYRAPVVAGCLLRAAGFGMLGWVNSLPALIVACVAIGFAAALFNPAVRAWLAAAAGERRVDAFAVFNVYYQSGLLLGPLVGLSLLAVDFRLVCAVAAALFAALTVLQWRALSAGGGPVAGAAGSGVPAQWRTVVANRPFLLFSGAMAGSYVLASQVYLALPLAAADALGRNGTAVTCGLFVVSAAVTVTGQLRLTGWAKERWDSGAALVRGLVVMGTAFAPLALVGPGWKRGELVCLVVAVVLLAAGAAVVYPFEMDTVMALSDGRLVATHYGFYSTVSGIGVTLGNLATGALWDLTRQRAALMSLTWGSLTVLGLACAAAVAALARGGHLNGR